VTTSWATPSGPIATNVQERTELRNHVARSLEQKSAPIINDAISIFPYAGVETAEVASHHQLAGLIVQLLALAAREGDLDPRSDLVGDLHQAAEETRAGVAKLFGLVYVVERAALDELALDESFGATSEPWPALARIVRRSSFELLAAYAGRLENTPGAKTIIDPLTTLHTKPVLVAALEKEIQRAERFGHPFALILMNVDRLADINTTHGYRSGDRVLERLGILLRNYFREQDWVARLAGDTIAVLLPETQREHAELLAERVRTTVEGRMALHDYRSEEQFPVTISVALVFAESVDPSVRAERLFDEARQAMRRAKFAGRNRVEKVEIALKRTVAPPRDNPLG
jgi:diguanylate cyclase (GGDEF)-like protein